MTQYHCCFLLILLMIVTPVTTAFARCEMISSELTSVQKSTVISTQHANKACLDAMPLQQPTKAQQFCHTSGHCGFYFCTHNATLHTNLYDYFNDNQRYLHDSNALLKTLFSSPELRPPITV